MQDKGLKLSAALSYYTLFSLGPMLMVLLSLAGIFYEEDAIEGKVFEEIVEFVGADAANLIQSVLTNLAISGKSNTAIAIGIVTLVMGATGVFIEIQDSINQIWRVKAAPKKGWVKLIINRFLSLSMVATLGFLLIVSLIINSLVTAFSSVLSRYFPEETLFLFDYANLGVTFFVLVVLFSIIYKVLPDAIIKWKSVASGAVFTSLLFMLGKYLIGLYIGYASVGSVYGAAGTIIVIAVWVYYSAAILFFGAEFTKVNAEASGEEIKPSKYATSLDCTDNPEL